MHELGLAQELAALALARAGGGRVTRVVVEVGKLALVLPDALRFCFEAVVAGTDAEGATLEVVVVPGEGRCRACGGRVELEGPLGQCACGSVDLEWVRGEELRLREVEAAPCA